MARPISEQSQILSDIHEKNINVLTGELFLHGYVGNDSEEQEIDYRVASSFIKNLSYLNHVFSDDILIHLNSIGGNWTDAMTIYDFIKYSRLHITILGHGNVSSSGTIIMQAADTRVLMPNCQFMIHFGIFSVDSDHLTAKEFLAQDLYAAQVMLNIYTEKCMNGPYFKGKNFSKGKVRSFLKRKMTEKRDWYISPEDAINFGFVDGILGSKGFERDTLLR